MKLLVITDTHLKATPAHDLVDPETNRSTRFEENVEALLGVLAAGKAAGCTGMLHGGDWVDGRNPKSVELEACAYLLNFWMKDGGRVWGVDGNHDRAIAKLSGSSVGPLSIMRRDGFKLYSEVGFDEELQALMVPYVHRATVEELAALIASAARARTGQGPVFALAHYGLKGCKMAAAGITIQSDYLAAEQFAACKDLDIVIAGHIHHGQTLQLTPAITGHLPGSPLIENFGEIEDTKSYLIFDTVTRQVERHLVPQPRKWVVADYAKARDQWAAQAMPAWNVGDIVKLTGTYELPDYPKDSLEAAFAAGLPRPFSLTYDVKKVQAERAVRSLEVFEGASLGDKVRFFARDSYPSAAGSEPGRMEAAVNQAVAAIEEQGSVVYAPLIKPVAIAISNFRTFKTVVHAFHHGEPTLITGKNGIGKTNFNEAVFFCLTGESSKGKALSSAVNQNQAEASVTLTLAACRPDETPVLYRIARSVKVNKKGAAAQKLSLHKQEADESWTDLSDGGVEETQAAINNLLGGSPRALRTTNFQFQDDKESLVDAKPTERQAIIGEICGLLPMQKAFKALDEQRKASNRAAEDFKARLAGMEAVGADAHQRRAAAEQALATANAEATAQEAALPQAQAAADAARAADTAAKAQVAQAQAAVDALPNTGAGLAGAEQALRGHQQASDAAVEGLRTRYAQAQARLKEAEGKLGALKAPDPAQVAALEATEKAARADVECLDAELKPLLAEASRASAAAETAHNAVVLHGDELAKAEAELAALGAEPAGEDLGAAQAQGELLLTQTDAEVQRLGGVVVEIQGRQAQATAALKQLGDDETARLAERASYDGKDIGKCSRCGHDIDSKHVEAELADIDKALAAIHAKVGEVRAQQSQLEQDLAAAREDLGKSSLAKTQLQAELKDLAARAQAQALRLQARAAAEAKVNDLKARGPAIAREAALRDSAAAAADMAQLTASKALAAAKAKLAAVEPELRALREVGTQMGALTAQVDSGRKALAELEAEGKAAAAAAEARTAELKTALEAAQKAHAINEATATALRGQVTAAQAVADEAGKTLVQALTRVETVKLALASAKDRANDQEAILNQLQAQAASLETARFELAMLLERAEIDTLAAGLLDPRTGVPNSLIDGMLPFLQERVNEYMDDMGMGRLAVELTTLDGDKETLAILVDNGRPGRKLDIVEYSGSQVGRIRYALKCAAGDLQRQSRGVAFGYTAYDEPAGLDEDGTKGLVQLLRDRCRHYPSTYIISHDERLISSFDNRLQFSQGPEDETVIN
jgi:DNA repair exonuclease SbcCD ATPase subunit/DNA repair exonuclease SbcCD nuclease subunit